MKVEVFRVDAPRAGGNRVVRIAVGEAGPEPLAVGSTDQEGRLTLAALPPGGVSVRLAMPGYVPGETPATLPAEGLDKQHEVTVPPEGHHDHRPRVTVNRPRELVNEVAAPVGWGALCPVPCL